MRISKLYTPQSQPNTSNPSTIASWKLNLLCANQRYVFSAHQDVVHVFEVGEASSGLALINLACRDEINNMVLKRITISSLGRAATTASSSSNEDTQTSETMHGLASGRLENNGISTWGIDISSTSMIAYSDNSYTVSIHDLKSGSTRRLYKHHHNVPSVCFSKDALTLCSASIDESVLLWNVENASLLCSFSEMNEWAWRGVNVAVQEIERARMVDIRRWKGESVMIISTDDTNTGVEPVMRDDDNDSVRTCSSFGCDGESAGSKSNNGQEDEDVYDERDAQDAQNEHVEEPDEKMESSSANEEEYHESISFSGDSMNEEYDHARALSLSENSDIWIVSSIMQLFFLDVVSKSNQEDDRNDITLLFRYNDPLAINARLYYSGMNRLAFIHFLPAPFSLLVVATQSGKVGLLKLVVSDDNTLHAVTRVFLQVNFFVAGLWVVQLTSIVSDLYIMNSQGLRCTYRIYADEQVDSLLTV